MKQAILREGKIVVTDVPAPQIEPGAVLVSAAASCISVGTELGGIRASNLPLWKRALQRPDQVRRLVQLVRTEGVARTHELVRSRLGHASPLGYSLSGTVVAVGAGVDDVFVGERVACAGAQAAYHAEFVCVPRNLVVPVPDGVDHDAAATVTLGAIALQGIRRTEPTIGETVVVVGLGILGQLTVRMLKASGIHTVGADLDGRRVDLALKTGLDFAIGGGGSASEEQVARLTGGVGADAVIVTAAAASPGLLGAAFRMCRRKGRVVLVGDVPIEIDRADIYAKELDFRISTSYGPGRYDRRYEEEGLDYPVGYVRWTENRNMQAYLDLLGRGAVCIGDLIEARFPIDRAPEAYETLQSSTAKPLGVILTYARTAESIPVRRTDNRAAKLAKSGALRVAIIGAGGFAKSVLLPIVQKENTRFQLTAVCSRQGHSAAEVARQFQAGYSTTDYDAVLSDPQIDAVMIATRHDRHADMVLRALQAGKHVFVEKPLCINEAELSQIEQFYRDGTDGKPLLMTGFNRRFSRYAAAILKAVGGRTNPLIINYRVNAGYAPVDSWVHGAQGGGRNIGEACHFYDVFVGLVGAEVTSIDARAIRPATAYYRASDNFSATMGFRDGSLATLLYTAMGSAEFPKEQFEVYSEGRVLSVDDYKDLSTSGANGLQLSTSVPEKGHREGLVAFADALRNGQAWPIPLWQQIEAMRIAFTVESRIMSPVESSSESQ